MRDISLITPKMSSLFEFLSQNKNRELEKDHVTKVASLLDEMIIQLKQAPTAGGTQKESNTSGKGILKKKNAPQTPFQQYLKSQNIEFTLEEQEIQ